MNALRLTLIFLGLGIFITEALSQNFSKLDFLEHNHSHKHEHHHDCGTSIPETALKPTGTTFQAKTASSPKAKAFFPIKHWVIADASGTHDAPISEFDSRLALLNQAYEGAGIQFYSIGTEVINNEEFSFIDRNSGEDIQMYDQLATPSAINVFWTKTNGWSWAQFPGGNRSNYIVMNVYHAPQTFVHEFGHTFSLLHTFQGGNELVDGSNCSIAGDYICDTPADEAGNPYGPVENCIYTGTETDANGHVYQPMVNNFMSYYPAECQNAFTPGQHNRASFAVDYADRLNLLQTPEAPTNLVVTIESNNISLSWTDNSAMEGGFEIEKISEGEKEIILVNPNVITYDDHEVTGNKVYKYRVRSVNYDKPSTWTQEIRVNFGEGGDCNTPAWSSTSTYTAGNEVSFNNKKYRSKWWNQNAQPDQNSGPWDVWQDLGTCADFSPDPYSFITNLCDQDQLWFLPGHSGPFTLQFETNDVNGLIQVDSIKVLIIDNYATSGNVREFTVTAPFEQAFLPELSNRTDIQHVAYYNGTPGDTKEISVFFREPAIPSLSLTSPQDQLEVWIHELTSPIQLKVSLNATATDIDRVHYQIANIFTNHAEVENIDIHESPFEHSFVPVLCSRIEITAVAIDAWGRASSIDQVTLYPKEFNPQITIDDPINQETILMDLSNPTPIDVFTTLTNGEPILGVAFRANAYNGGSSQTLNATLDESEPYTFEFVPVISDSITVEAFAVSNFGPPATDIITIFVGENVQQCEYQPWSSTQAYLGGDRVELNGNVYEAKWWTLNENPSQNSNSWDPWSDLGPCNSLKIGVDLDGSTGFRAYPSPMTDALTIELPNSGSITITNAQGTIMNFVPQADKSLRIDAKNWPNGIYFIQLMDNENGIEKTLAIPKQ